MATSGSNTVAIYSSWLHLKFNWSQKSQSVANNTTTISWNMQLISGNGALYKGDRTWTVKIDGKTYTGKVNISLDKNSTQTLASGTATITHNSDGTKTFVYSFSQQFELTLNNGSYMGTYSGSGSDILATIARASQPSLVTYPNSTANVGEFGQEFSIHMNTASQSFTHTVRYEYGNRTGTIATGVVNGTTWEVPLVFMNDIPNATSASGRIYVDTYSGSTKIGTKYTGFTVTVPTSVKPSCTFKAVDATTIVNTYGSLVKGLSKLAITVTAQTAYSSPIVSYTIKANGQTQSGENLTSWTSDYLKTAGKNSIDVTVKDGRGRSYTQHYEFTALDYTPPKVSALSVRRCDADGTANDRGDHVKATFSASVSSMSNKNTATYKLKYKKSNATSYTPITLDDLANNYSVSNYSYIFAADGSSSYDVEVTATDRHYEALRNTSASTAFTLMNFNPYGNGLGIGQVSEKQNTLQIGLDVEIQGKSIVDIIYPVGSIYLAYNHTNPSTLFPNTSWTRIYGAFPWFTDANGQIGTTGGERTVTLTASQIPSHNHGGTYTNAGTARTHAWLASGGSAMGYDTINTGGGEAHNNMPPYIQISAWRRTA